MCAARAVLQVLCEPAAVAQLRHAAAVPEGTPTPLCSEARHAEQWHAEHPMGDVASWRVPIISTINNPQSPVTSVAQLANGVSTVAVSGGKRQSLGVMAFLIWRVRAAAGRAAAGPREREGDDALRERRAQPAAHDEPAQGQLALHPVRGVPRV